MGNLSKFKFSFLLVSVVLAPGSARASCDICGIFTTAGIITTYMGKQSYDMQALRHDAAAMVAGGPASAPLKKSFEELRKDTKYADLSDQELAVAILAESQNANQGAR